MLDESYSAGEQADIECQPGHNLHQQAPLVCDHTGKCIDDLGGKEVGL